MKDAKLDRRQKVLYGIGKKRGRLHRYTVIRWVVGVLATIGVMLLPALGILRFDLWSGRHYWLGEPADVLRAAKAFAFPFLAINIVIILASRFLGRWLCGFVCPIGNLNRMSEWLAWNFRKGRRRYVSMAVMGVLCGLLAAITFSFWVDWRVFREGSSTAMIVAGVFLFGLSAGLYGIVRGLGMRFCRDYCPSGVYFAVLGPVSATGIEFAHPEACTECKACEVTCPVDLEPRHILDGPTRPGTGFYPDGLTNSANCLRCGDCVVVCEATTNRNETPTPLRMGFVDEALAAAGAPSDGRSAEPEPEPERPSAVNGVSAATDAPGTTNTSNASSAARTERREVS